MQHPQPIVRARSQAAARRSLACLGAAVVVATAPLAQAAHPSLTEDTGTQGKGRFELEARVAQFTAKYAIGQVPRPDYWSGFRIKPVLIEFWEDRPFRLHDRTVYHRNAAGPGPEGGWTVEKLFP